MSKPLLRIFYADKLYSLSATTQETTSYFGGPFPGVLAGIPHGPAPLHPVATLNLSDLLLPGENPGLSTQPCVLPLIYGFQFDGCELEYDICSVNEINITASSEKRSSNSWPYKKYPVQFPKIFLNLTEVREVPYEDFSYECAGLPGTQQADIIVLVPPPSTIGVSLWGKMGDEEEVTVIFEYKPQTASVKTYNVCG